MKRMRWLQRRLALTPQATATVFVALIENGWLSVLANQIGFGFVLALAMTGPWATYKHIPATDVLIPTALAGHLVVVFSWLIVSKTRIVIGLAGYTFAALCAVVALSYFWSIRPHMWGVHMAWWGICFVCFLAALNFVKGEGRIKLFAFACGVGALLTLPQLNMEEFHRLGGAWRYTVSAHNANFTAYVLTAYAYVAIAVLRLFKTSTVEKIGLGVTILPVCVGLYFLNSRGAQIALMLTATAALASIWLPRGWQTVAVIAMLIVAVIVPSGLLSPLLSIVDTFSAKGTGDLSSRLVLWEEARQRILDNPMLGIGAAGFPVTSVVEKDVHNFFLGIMVEFGLLGFVCVVAMGRALWLAVRHRGVPGMALLLMFTSFFLPIASTGQILVMSQLWIVLGITFSIAACLNESLALQSIDAANTGV
ncbi:O-antigen ligase family protein [Pelagibacterium mangrovi]|uniref:O-antigen ligase family protein n=1 Tax=Pelagibacterium mangrovi TaxID=3119828 RepID=UPI002FC619FE